MGCENLVVILCIIIPQCYNAELGGGRQGRWFGYKYTETKIRTDVVTSLIPSSCVHVEPSLPPCRDVRKLEHFPKFLGKEIYPDYINGKQLNNEPSQHSFLKYQDEAKSMGWAEYFGLAPTTITIVKLHTTTVLNPQTVVTFSVKGCRPTKLPLDLENCPLEEKETVVPTKTVEEITTTLPVDVGSVFRSYQDFIGTDLSASEIDLELNNQDSQTEKLNKNVYH